MMTQQTIANDIRKISRKSGINPIQPVETLLAKLWQEGLIIDLVYELADRLESERECKRDYQLEY